MFYQFYLNYLKFLFFFSDHFYVFSLDLSPARLSKYTESFHLTAHLVKLVYWTHSFRASKQDYPCWVRIPLSSKILPDAKHCWKIRLRESMDVWLCIMNPKSGWLWLAYVIIQLQFEIQGSQIPIFREWSLATKIAVLWFFFF